MLISQTEIDPLQAVAIPRAVRRVSEYSGHSRNEIIDESLALAEIGKDCVLRRNVTDANGVGLELLDGRFLHRRTRTPVP